MLEQMRAEAKRRAEAARMVMPDGERWIDGLPLGNGDIGVMLWGSRTSLKLTLDKSDLWDTRMTWPEEPDFNYATMRQCAAEGDWERFQWLFEDSVREPNPLAPTKIYFGRAEIALGDEVTRQAGELSFYRGVAELALVADGRPCRLQAFVHKQRNLLCVGIDGAEIGITVHGLAETNPVLAELDSYGPQREGQTLVQSIPDGPSCAAAWEVGPEGTLLVALETAQTPDAALQLARETLAAGAAAGWEALLVEHEAAWADYWAASGLAVPEKKAEHLWRLGQYLSACSTRQGCLPPGLQGVWQPDGGRPPWHGDYHADMNVQESFWPVYANNHPELGRCLMEFLSGCLPAAKHFCKRFFGWEGAFFPTAFVPGMVFVPGWSTAQFWMGVPGWLAHHMWLQWQYERDELALADHIVPFLREVFKFYEGLLEEGEDGRLHVPLSTSPEMHDNRPEAWHRDTTCDLAIIRNLCGWLIETEAATGEPVLTTRAEAVRGKLAEYPLNSSGGLQLWPGQDYFESHRHPSHLMSIHPFDDLNLDSEASRAIVQRSMWEFVERGMGRWAGHTFPQSLALAARAGWGEMAREQIRLFHDHFLAANGLHLNGDWRRAGISILGSNVFCMEANCGIAGTIPEMLLQSWGGRLRLFPAVPEDWSDAGFHSLRAEGGWLVSAVRRQGRVAAVSIRATVAGQCRLRNPFEGTYRWCGGPVQEDGEDLLVELAAGETTLLTAE
ncbi:MAG: glycoside hydrolase family 95-like protein [Armatimonadia bacterium]